MGALRSFTAFGLVSIAIAAIPSTGSTAPLELVIFGGRVLDPATGLDGVYNVGIDDGRVTALTTTTLEGRRTLDARGLAVAPGFIDLNTYEHGDPLFRLRALDGTTAVVNLEQGALDVDAYYSELEGKALIHYGAGIGHWVSRMAVTEDPGHRPGVGVHDNYPASPQRDRALTEEELGRLLNRMRNGLDAGAVGLALGVEYTPGATQSEILELFRLGASRSAPVHLHMRGFDPTRDWDDLYEVLAGAMISRAQIHINHLNSSAGSYTKRYLEILKAARSRGLDLTTECYPYEAGMTFIESAVFDGHAKWSDDEFTRLEWPLTGERLTRGSFLRYRQAGGPVILHQPDPTAHEAQLEACIADPQAMIASDSSWDEGRTHPRVAGTNARVLGRYVREKRTTSLLRAIAKLSWLPARHLERRVPAMKSKGRIRVGADADLVIFDPARILDRADFRSPTRPPTGIRAVFVSGTLVVDRGRVKDGVYPGRPIRAPHAQPRGDEQGHSDRQ